MSQRAVKPQKTNKPNPVVSGMRTPVYGCYHVYSKVSDKNAFRSVDSDLNTHSMILDSISRRFDVVLNLQNSFPAGISQGKIGYTFSVSSPQSFLFPLNFTGRSTSLHLRTDHVLITEAANVDAILFFSNGTFDVIK